MTDKELSIDIVAENFTKLVEHEHWPANRFIEESLRDKWCNELFTLSVKSPTYAIESAFLKGQISALTKIINDRDYCLKLHKENLKNIEEREKKLSEDVDTFRRKFIGRGGKDIGRVGVKEKFLRGFKK